MASGSLAFETGHEEMIHDAQLDYYGKRLATASSDRTIRVFDVSSGQQQTLVAELKGHDGPVWQVAWGHPKYGSLLASCSYDRKVIIWKEEENGTWTKLFDNPLHESSVNGVAWAPHVFGLILATASADGKVNVLSYKPETNAWEREEIPSPGLLGLNAVSWAPAVPAVIDPSQQGAAPLQRLVTGGCDSHIRVFTKDAQNKHWTSQSVNTEENKHTDWVRDVAWAPSLSAPSGTIASCSEDKTVKLWTEAAGGQWQLVQTLEFDSKVWRVSWSVMGNILAVAQGDNKVSMWKEGADGQWSKLQTLTENDQE